MYDSRNLYKLFIPYVFNNPTSPALTGMELDSRNIVLGNLFVAVKGSKTDGRLYIDYAIKKGASAVLLESWSDITISKKYSYHLNKIPVVHVNYLPRYLSDIAGSFYNHPSRFLDLIGVTGTNGKTTITHLLARWVQLLGKKSAVMGTLGNGMLNNMCLSNNTTCSSIDAQKILSQFVKDKITFVAMEVSSHGLNQYRVDALYFKAAIFTNLSHDHLDYHGNVMQYSMSKWRLFDELCVEKYIINADDPVGCRWLYYLPQAIAVTITRNLPFFWKGKWICALKVNYHIHGTDITFDSSWGHGVIHSQLLGEFNVSNLLLALGTLLILGYPLSLLVHTSSQLQPVAGRMEVFRSHGYPTVIVDYAHTPDALEKVLISIRQFYYWGQLWCVFGCGGDRDPSKRALMGCIVSRYADYIIITNDNPRTEEPQSIINDITRGITHRKKIIKIIQNRCCAIQTAILKASLEDVILISGKGHEKYQIIGNNRIYHSDKDIVENFFKERCYFMIPFSLHEIAPVLNAKYIGMDLIIHEITINSNIIHKQCMFIALIGKRFDGHDFTSQAIAAGAQALLVNHHILLDVPQLIVPDTRCALIMLARWVRQKVSSKVIAITGSSGKTSVKEMTTSILKECGHTIATQGNFNNMIGVPITLLRLTKKNNFAIIELGTSSPGELVQLSKIVAANVALVNNVYPAHLSGFKSLSKIGKEKGKIFSELDLNGTGIINADSHALSLWRKPLKGKSMWFFSLRTNVGIDFFASNIISEKNRIRFILHTPYGTSPVVLSMLGTHNVANALAASALAFSVGANLSEVVYGLENIKTLPGRLFPIILGEGKLLLDDTYNSNVGSMISAIHVLTTMPGYRILVVSDMLELGKYKSIKYHCYIGKLIATTNINKILTIGSVSCCISKICGKGKHFRNKNKLIIYIKQMLSIHNSISVLVKGSRGFKMEQIINAIRDESKCYFG